MGIIEKIVSSPLYTLLIGGGGIIAIAIAIVGICKKKNKGKIKDSVSVNKSKKTKISGNLLKGKEVKVNRSEDTTIKDNY